MLSRLSIALRLLLLVLVPVTALVIVGMSALASVQASATATTAYDRSNRNLVELLNLSQTLQADLLGVVSQAAAGAIRPREALQRIRVGEEQSAAGYGRVLPLLDSVSTDLRDQLSIDAATVDIAFDRAVQALESPDPESLQVLINGRFIREVQGAIDTLGVAGEAVQANADRILTLSQGRNTLFMGVNASLGAIGLVVALVLGYYIARSITQPVQTMTGVVRGVAAGDFSPRAKLSGFDEIAQLGNALDQLLDERVATLADAEEENAQLNDSVIGLLRAVSRLSKRDLTVRVPVTEDVTGPVADAINQLTKETNRVLLDVAQVADQVAEASSLVNDKAHTVNETAEAQGREVSETSEQLAMAASRLAEIAEIARQCNTLAEQTSEQTDSAVASVNSTLTGMNNIREVIQETGKRIKRLGERSQEISGVVDIINQITERTTVLALNASMQAAAAGEAGRGFAVVADEVQRLAESSRNATAQIATLVKSIQVETNDTIGTMDQAIDQVIEGSKLAEGAGQQMNDTRQSTTELVDSVLRIAASSQEQAQLSQTLRDRAQEMVQRSSDTGREVSEQLVQTSSMAEYAKQLLTSVQQFQLAT